MLSKLWQWLAAMLGVIAAYALVLLKVRERQLDDARDDAKESEQRADTAETRIEQRDKANEANAQAKEEGDRHVQEAVDRARSGSRDHFE